LQPREQARLRFASGLIQTLGADAQISANRRDAWER
jgi:hypothetical protein